MNSPIGEQSHNTPLTYICQGHPEQGILGNLSTARTNLEVMTDNVTLV